MGKNSHIKDYINNPTTKQMLETYKAYYDLPTNNKSFGNTIEKQAQSIQGSDDNSILRRNNLYQQSNLFNNLDRKQKDSMVNRNSAEDLAYMLDQENKLSLMVKQEQNRIQNEDMFFNENQSILSDLARARDAGDKPAVMNMMMQLFGDYQKRMAKNDIILDNVDPDKLTFAGYNARTGERINPISLKDIIRTSAERNIQDPMQRAYYLSPFDEFYKKQYQQAEQMQNLQSGNVQADIDLKRAHAGLYNQQAVENSSYGQQRKLDEFRQKEEIKKDVETAEGKRQTTNLLNNAASNLIQTAGSKLLEMNPLEKGVRKNVIPSTIDPIIGDQEMAYQNLQNAIFSSVQNFRAASELKNIVVPKIGENEKTQVTKLITLIELYGDMNDPALQQNIQQLQNKYKIDSKHLKEFYNKALPKYNELQQEINNSQINNPNQEILNSMQNAVDIQNQSPQTGNSKTHKWFD